MYLTGDTTVENLIANFRRGALFFIRLMSLMKNRVSVKKVRLNKDASEVRDYDRFVREICQICQFDLSDLSDFVFQ